MRAENSGVNLLKSPVRRRILGLLHAYAGGGQDGHGGLTAAQLADTLDMHVTSVRFHLDQLVDSGLVIVRTVRSDRVGRPHKLYLAAPGALPAAPEQNHTYETLAVLLTSVLDRAENGTSLTAEEAGLEWCRLNIQAEDIPPATTAGQWLGKIGRMVDVLQEWGYTPDVATSREGRNAEVRLLNCPVLPLARTDPAVVCGVHRGLILGSMRQFGESAAEVTLEPFVTPTMCVAHVTTSPPFESLRRPVTPPPGSTP